MPQLRHLAILPLLTLLASTAACQSSGGPIVDSWSTTPVTTSPGSASTPPTGAAAPDKRDYGSIPAELRGTWCSTADPSRCINLADFVAASGAASMDYTAPSDQPGRLAVCLKDDQGAGQCSMSQTVLFEYLPAGMEWSCLAAAKAYDLASCDPDYTSEHDASQPRLRWVVLHQQGSAYEDSEPLYRNPSATGTFGDLSVLR